MADATELVELAIDEYKNLEAMRLPWSRHVVVFGANGVGKSNLLEAIALAFGSRATTWQLARRATAPRPGAISALLRTSGRVLPLSPAVAMRAPEEMKGSGTIATSLLGSKRFWTLLGIESGDSWSEAVISGGLDVRLARVLAAMGDRPMVRYRLERITGLEEARTVSRGSWFRSESDDDPRAVTFSREFSRTLALDGGPPDWLIEMAPELPTPFAPLRRWLDEAPGVRSPYCELLELPSASVAPVRVVWLSAERSSAEAWYDLAEAYEAARVPASSMRLHLDRFLFRGNGVEDEEDPAIGADADWWLTWYAAKSASAVLARSMPHLQVVPEDAGVVAVESERETAPRILTGGDLESLSSGERAWTDVALARAAADLDQLTDDMDWVNTGLAVVSDEELLDVATDLESVLDVFNEEYWSAQDVEAAFLRLSRLFGSADDVLRRWLSNVPTSQQRLMEETIARPDAGLRAALMRRLTLEVYDEPERHLHASAQRRVATGIASALTAASVTLSSHSHLFLGAPGANHFHLAMTGEGVVAESFSPSRLDVAAAVTRELGLDRGELLGLTDYVLIVEGRVDQLVLRSFFGDVLDDARVRLLSLSGVDETASLAELELIGIVLDVPIGVMFDHTRVERVVAGSGGTKEEDALLDLRRALTRRGKDFGFFGLKREDIAAYLDEGAIATVAPSFPGWHQLQQHRRTGEKFKDVFERVAGRRITVRFVEQVIDTMREQGRRPGVELADVVADVVAAAR